MEVNRGSPEAFKLIHWDNPDEGRELVTCVMQQSDGLKLFKAGLEDAFRRRRTTSMTLLKSVTFVPQFGRKVGKDLGLLELVARLTHQSLVENDQTTASLGVTVYDHIICHARHPLQLPRAGILSILGDAATLITQGHIIAVARTVGLPHRVAEVLNGAQDIHPQLLNLLDCIILRFYQESAVPLDGHRACACYQMLIALVDFLGSRRLPPADEQWTRLKNKLMEQSCEAELKELTRRAGQQPDPLIARGLALYSSRISHNSYAAAVLVAALRCLLQDWEAPELSMDKKTCHVTALCLVEITLAELANLSAGPELAKLEAGPEQRRGVQTMEQQMRESYAPCCQHCGAKQAEGGKKLLICSGCDVIRYCKRECQRADWQKHKPLCKKKASQS